MQPAQRLPNEKPTAIPGIMPLTGTIAIGSAPGSNVGTDDPTIAPNQAEIRVGAGQITLVPLGTGVTMLNDAVIDGPMPLAPGDTIRVGRLQLHLTPRGLEYEDTAGRWLVERRRPRALPQELLDRLKHERSAFTVQARDGGRREART